MTPQWRRSLNLVLMRDARTYQRVVGEFAHEASGVHVPSARCDIVRKFLAHPARPEWLWMVDTDATFADDILERLLAAASRRDRPIVGALAFGVAPKKVGGVEAFNQVGSVELELFPTLYVLDGDKVMRLDDYPRDQVVHVHSTGAHCLLIHRDVLKDKRWEDGHPLPWFRTAVLNGGEVSEDQFFCMKAGSLGFPVHVDTSIKTGHVKTFVADEDWYLRCRS